MDGFLTKRITSAGTTTFTYSSRGELLSASLPDGTAITYDHDPMGRRIAKRVNGTIIEKYLWQGVTRLLAVYDGNNNLVMRFTYADGRMPVSMTKGGITYYLFYDQIGSLRAVVDSSGQIVKELVYDSFGYQYNESNPSFTTPFGFAGGLLDKDTGLVRFGARDYDPTIGKWTAKDPINFAGGDANLFGYVGNNPVSFIDPKGLMPLWLELADIAFTIWKSLFWIDPANYKGEDEWMREYNERQDLFKRIDQLEKDLPELAKRLEDQIKDLEARKEFEKMNNLCKQ